MPVRARTSPKITRPTIHQWDAASAVCALPAQRWQTQINTKNYIYFNTTNNRQLRFVCMYVEFCYCYSALSSHWWLYYFIHSWSSLCHDKLKKRRKKQLGQTWNCNLQQWTSRFSSGLSDYSPTFGLFVDKHLKLSKSNHLQASICLFDGGKPLKTEAPVESSRQWLSTCGLWAPSSGTASHRQFLN